jgi:hypothetical protein
MKNLHLVFSCEDYKIEEEVLLIEDAELVGMVENIDQFNESNKRRIYHDFSIISKQR